MATGMSDGRWIEVEPSQFAHEREALDFIRRALPDSDPWHAWSNFTFIDTNGKPAEVDLLVVAPRGVFLIEIKSYPDGKLDAGAGTWTWQRPDGSRSSNDNPLTGADGKAKRLKSLLLAQKPFRRGGPANAKSLWVEALVFLSSPNLQVDLDPRLDGSVLGPGQAPDNDGHDKPANRLPGLIEYLKRLDAHRGAQVNKPLANAIVDAMNHADIRQSEKYRNAGTYRLIEAIEEGDTWVDYRSTHRLSKVDRRIRLHVHSRAADDDEKQAMQRAVEREFRLLSKLRHPAIESPVELVPNPRGLAQVYPYEPDAVRLDHWLAEHPDADLLDRLDLFRDIAEGVAYAHEHGLSHRSLSPRRVWVVEVDGKPTARLRDWTTVARDAGTRASALPTAADRTRHVTSFELMAGKDAAAYMAPELHTIPDADGKLADVFALGCLLHLLVSGRPPAADGDGLRELLDQHGHVPLSAALDQAPTSLVEIIEYTTQRDVAVRLDSVAELLAWLESAEQELTEPDPVDLLQATRGVEVDGWTVVSRIGAGASSVVLLVEDHNGKREVFKVARDADHAQRLRAEHDALVKLRHRAVVEAKGLDEIGGHTVLRLEAGQVRSYGDDKLQAETLASRLKADGPPTIDLIQRWGNDLLDALIVMENEGVDHRDLKPENLVFVERGKDKQTHLAVIDFSLTSAKHDDIDVGTVGYLDPFLRERQPRRWDLAAERYAAAVVLTELVTGARPSWGDGVDPQASDLEVPEIRSEGVDAAIADRVVPVLQRAMHRDVSQRYGTADELRRAWEHVFAAVDEVTSQPGAPAVPVDDLDLSSVTASTPIADLDLAPRLVGAIERLGVADAGGLARVPANDLTRVGIGAVVRRELRRLIARLRELGLADEVEQIAALDDTDLQRVSVDRLADRLAPPSNLGEERTRRLRVLLGLEIDAMDGRWPTIPATAEACGDDATEVADELEKARRRWANDRPELTVVRQEVADWLASQEGVATGEEVAQMVLGRRGSAVDDPIVRLRRARAVVRAVVEAEASMVTPRFRGVRVGEQLFVALDTATEVEGRGRIEWVADPLVEAAVALGERADELVAESAVTSPSASASALSELALQGLPDGVSFEETRRLRLAAAASTSAALSSRGELYRRGLPPVDAIAAARLALMSRWGLTPEQIRDRVGARFPHAEPIPNRPALDTLMEEADAGLEWQGEAGRYLIAEAGGTPSSGWAPSSGTQYTSMTQVDLDIQEFELSMRRLASDGGFIAATVDGRHLAAAARRLTAHLEASHLDLDAELVAAMRQVAKEVNADWPFILDADAAEASSQKFTRLQLFVERAAGRLKDQIRAAGRIVVVTNLGLLARYQQLGLLDELRDELTHSDRELEGDLRGLLVLVPDTGAMPPPEVDGKPIPVVTAGQTAHVPSAWLERRAA